MNWFVTTLSPNGLMRITITNHVTAQVCLHRNRNVYTYTGSDCSGEYPPVENMLLKRLYMLSHMYASLNLSPFHYRKRLKPPNVLLPKFINKLIIYSLCLFIMYHCLWRLYEIFKFLQGYIYLSMYLFPASYGHTECAPVMSFLCSALAIAASWTISNANNLCGI